MDTEVRFAMALMFVGSVLLPKRPPLKWWLKSQSSRSVLISQDCTKRGNFIMEEVAATRLINHRDELVWN